MSIPIREKTKFLHIFQSMKIYSFETLKKRYMLERGPGGDQNIKKKKTLALFLFASLANIRTRSRLSPWKRVFQDNMNKQIDGH